MCDISVVLFFLPDDVLSMRLIHVLTTKFRTLYSPSQKTPGSEPYLQVYYNDFHECSMYIQWSFKTLDVIMHLKVIGGLKSDEKDDLISSCVRTCTCSL